MARIVSNNAPFPEDDLTDPERNFALGQFMTAWSQVESMYGFLFRELAEIPSDSSSIIFDRVGVREQLEIVQALSDAKLDGDDKTKAETILDQVEKISVLRNKIVHAGWGKINGESARFWNGLTGRNLEEIAGDTQKGLSLRERYIHTISHMTNLTARCTGLRDQLYPIVQRASSRSAERIRAQVGPRPSFPPRPNPTHQ
jgi:hypothetical protein